MGKRTFAAFILTHGRADNVSTVKSLSKYGYTGEYYIVIDDEDEQGVKYKEKFGDKVKVFCKQHYMDKMDVMNPDKPRGCVVYARNACFDIARELGLTHFLELDDDYVSFEWRWIDGEKLKVKKTKN